MDNDGEPSSQTLRRSVCCIWENWESIVFAKLARWVIAVINDMMEKQKETKRSYRYFHHFIGEDKEVKFWTY